jgi:hypothetical protein
MEIPPAGGGQPDPLQAAGSIPVAFTGWHIKVPGGFGVLGSLASHGIAEFRLVLRRSDN